MSAWKPVKGYEGFYEVSDQGEIKSLERKISYVHRVPAMSARGRCQYERLTQAQQRRAAACRSRGDNQETGDGHRLVAEAFIPNALTIRLRSTISTVTSKTTESRTLSGSREPKTCTTLWLTA